MIRTISVQITLKRMVAGLRIRKASNYSPIKGFGFCTLEVEISVHGTSDVQAPDEKNNEWLSQLPVKGTQFVVHLL